MRGKQLVQGDDQLLAWRTPVAEEKKKMLTEPSEHGRSGSWSIASEESQPPAESSEHLDGGAVRHQDLRRMAGAGRAVGSAPDSLSVGGRCFKQRIEPLCDTQSRREPKVTIAGVTGYRQMEITGSAPEADGGRGERFSAELPQNQGQRLGL